MGLMSKGFWYPGSLNDGNRCEIGSKAEWLRVGSWMFHPRWPGRYGGGTQSFSIYGLAWSPYPIFLVLPFSVMQMPGPLWGYRHCPHLFASVPLTVPLPSLCPNPLSVAPHACCGLRPELPLPQLPLSVVIQPTSFLFN